MPISSMQYTPDCYRCSGQQVVEVPAAVPDGCAEWCGWSPTASWKDIPQCRTCHGYEPDETPFRACAGWCGWSPVSSWQYISACQGCGLRSGLAEAKAGSMAVIGEPKPEKTGLKTKAATGYPNWCSTVPFGSLQYVPDCRGYAGSASAGDTSACANWCQWMPISSMQYTPDCYRCSGQQVVEVPAAVPDGCAEWCGWSPTASWKDIPQCRTCHGYEPDETPFRACAGWCGWSPVSSWQYISACQGCGLRSGLGPI